VACEFAHEITFYWVLYGLLFAALFKLLRFDNIAKQIFSAALIGPIFALVMSIPLLVVYSLLAYFNLEEVYRWLIAVLIVALLVVCFFIIKYELKRNSYWSEAARSFHRPWWDLKFHFIVYFDTYYPWSWSNKQVRKNKFQPSYETQVVEIAKTIGTEVKNRFFYQLSFVCFCIFIYWWFKEFAQIRFIYDFLNYGISAFAKYPIWLTTITLAVATYCYTKYYDIFAKHHFDKMICILKMLEKEQTFLYVIDERPLQLAVLKQIPRAITDPTKFGKFDYLDDKTQFMYWISADTKYLDYIKTQKVLRRYGIEGYLDLRNEIKNSDKEKK
jgi:hypothetical protein